MPEPEVKLEPRKRILSVDDDHEFNQLLVHRFSLLNCEIKTTTSVDSFFTTLNTFKPDLFLIDLNIGDTGNGYAVIHKIKSTIGLSDIPIVVISSQSETKSIAHAFEIGANDYLTKPTDKDRFHVLLKRYLNLANVPEVITDPLREIYEHQSAIEFTISTQVTEISESGIKILTPQLIRKGTVFYIQGEFVNKIFTQEERVLCSALSSEIVTMVDRNYFAIDIEFENLNEKAKNSLKGWLLTETSKK